MKKKLLVLSKCHAEHYLVQYKELDVNHLANGVYLMEVYVNDARFVKQLIIEK